MKTKIFTFLTIMLALASCQTEDIETFETLDTTSINLNGSRGERCDIDFTFPTFDPNHTLAGSFITVTIQYHPDLPVSAFDCIRYEYATQHHELLDLSMCVLQPTDPYLECWRFRPGYPDQQTDVTICDDPRFQAGHCD